MKKVGRFLGRFVGYPMFFLLCFVLFAYLTFPYGRLRDFVVSQVENPVGPGGQRRPGPYRLRIVDLSPSWFTGARATGVTLTKLPENPEEPPMLVTFEYIHARISLLSLLFGEKEISFETRVGGGTISGTAILAGEDRSIDATIDGVRLRRVGILRDYVGLPVKGRATGHIVMQLREDRATSTGEIDLDIDDTTIGDGTAKLRFDANAFTRAGLTFPETHLGDVSIEASMEGGTLNVSKLESDGEDIQFGGQGSVQVRNAIINSSVDAMLRIGISESYREDNAGIFMAVENEPRVRAAWTESRDALQFHVVGNIGPRMRFQGAGSSPWPPPQ